MFGIAAAIGNMLGGTLADRVGPVADRDARPDRDGDRADAAIGHPEIRCRRICAAGYSGLIFCWGIGGWTFYPGQVANLVQIEPQASMIALSLNASAMYLGFAVGGALGGVVLDGAFARRPRLGRRKQRGGGAGAGSASGMAAAAQNGVKMPVDWRL